MALGQISYRSLSPEKRRAGAKIARERLRGALMSPALTPDQQAYLKAEMAKIDAWERCELPCVGDDPPPG